MSGPDAGWGGPPLWQVIVGALAVAGSYFTGGWSNAKSQGQLKERAETNSRQIADIQKDIRMLQTNQSSGLERLRAVGERVDRIEEQHEGINEKLGSMAEKIAQMPTRAEIREEIKDGFTRIEGQVRDIARARTH